MTVGPTKVRLVSLFLLKIPLLIKERTLVDEVNTVLLPRLVLVKCLDNKMVKPPYNCFIFPLTQL